MSRSIDTRLTRRGFLKAGTSAGLAGLFSVDSTLHSHATVQPSGLLGFEAIEASTADTIRLPEDYLWRPLISWGDPLFVDAPVFDPSGASPSEHQAMQFGDNNDGMELFPLSPDRAVLVVNNEFPNYRHLFPHQGRRLSADDIVKAQNAVGVSILEIRLDRHGHWIPVLDSKFNRRVHARTPTILTGPAAGYELMKTQADPSGTKVLGTLMNCATGRTPWGTFLTCEENFHECFGVNQTIQHSTRQRRYGIADGYNPYQWHAFDNRFDVGSNPNEPNRFGWVVEIDPFDTGFTPRKRTALGRLNHENAAVHLNQDGHVVVYMGDDRKGEHLYRFVSRSKFNPDDPDSNLDLLDEGTLSVAHFDIHPGTLAGRGRWIDLSHGMNGLTAANGFPSQAEVLIFAREAATLLGATTLDQPEWVAVHPDGGQVYCSLTHNKYRGDPGLPVGGPNPRADNQYGQILRWSPEGRDHTSESFTWDLYVLAGNPLVHDDIYGGSDNVNPGNMFNSPDGIGFDSQGRLWIQTDGNDSDSGDFLGMGNNQMLCGDPGSGEIRRFLTGPVGAEITGLAFSPESTAMFAGIQHPGDSTGRESHFPGGGIAKPRSTVVVITRRDGGIIGT